MRRVCAQMSRHDWPIDSTSALWDIVAHFQPAVGKRKHEMFSSQTCNEQTPVPFTRPDHSSCWERSSSSDSRATKTKTSALSLFLRVLEYWEGMHSGNRLWFVWLFAVGGLEMPQRPDSAHRSLVWAWTQGAAGLRQVPALSGYTDSERERKTDPLRACFLLIGSRAPPPTRLRSGNVCVCARAVNGAECGVHIRPAHCGMICLSKVREILHFQVLSWLCAHTHTLNIFPQDHSCVRGL